MDCTLKRSRGAAVPRLVRRSGYGSFIHDLPQVLIKAIALFVELVGDWDRRFLKGRNTEMFSNKQGLRLALQLGLAIGLVFLLSLNMLGQSTIASGSIIGTVTDPSGAIVSGAKVSITNTGNGSTVEFTTNSAGAYSSGSLTPGTYKVQVTGKGFSTVNQTVAVQIGNTSTVNVKLQLGQENQVIEVQGSTVSVNTDQSSVQGVLTATQIETLPVNGRNFLDLAQLEPGVQIQDGTNFDPTKAGYESISFGGRFGRTARIQVDGVDMSDETVGTVTGGLPQSGIQEFQLAQSTMDLSNDLSSSGVVNVTTKSGTNSIHGQGFTSFRDSGWGATLPHPIGLNNTFTRTQYGGNIGGAIIKDKLFFFADSENTNQHAFAPVAYGAPFTAFAGGYRSPFFENDAVGRLDYNGPAGSRFFYRYSYSQIRSTSTFFPDALQPYANKNFVRQNVVGADFTRGSWSHAFRFGYLKFQNEIADATLTSGLPLADYPGGGLAVNIAPLTAGTGPQTGPNLLAPQQTPQSDHEVKYDGSKVISKHILRYGISYNRIQGGGFASFFGLAPQLLYDPSSTPISNICTNGVCGAANPLNYGIVVAILGNGQGFSTEKQAFGFPAGGLGPDNRLGAYITDTWKLKPNFTLNFGLRYDRDTGRTDSDLGAIPQLDNLTPAFPNLGNPIPNPNKNFAPSVGLAWDPWSNGKTAIRAGIGQYYENVIYNNVLFDRPKRLPAGAFLQTPVACSGGQTTGTIPGYNLAATAAECAGSIGAEAGALASLQQQLQAQTPFNPNGPNPNYVLNNLNGGANIGTQVSNPSGMFAPNYKSPRALQMNGGIQRELKPGMVLSVDYVRNVTSRLLVSQDLNQTGNIHYFNKAGAVAAIAATNASFGCATVDCAIGKGATIGNYSGNGLDSQVDNGGICASNPFGCAFGGLNPKAPSLQFLVPVSKSAYNALDVKFTDQIRNPMKGIKDFNTTVSYSYGSFTNCGGQAPATTAGNDQDFVLGAISNTNACAYMGPSLLDRTHQISFGSVIEVPMGFQFSFIGHFDSPLPVSLVSTNGGPSPGQIYNTDFDGDGTVDDLIPGTKLGAFGHSVNAGNINNILNKYNNTYANNPTPAGQLLVSNGLISASQLATPACPGPNPCGNVPAGYPGFGGVAQAVPLAPAGQVSQAWLRAFDFKLSWIGKVPIGDHPLTIQPSIGFFNLFNFSNFDLPPNTLTGSLSVGSSAGANGSINGTTQSTRVSDRVGIGTGVYSLGAPRQIEAGLTITF